MDKPSTNIDIAIIGLACRLPGAGNPDEYWNNLCNGIESVTFFSDSELLAAGVDAELLANPNYVKAAPMLRDIDMFDAPFFGFSPKDAALMDPQQRLFLEVCWEAFENAGYDPATCPDKVGVVSTAGGVVTSYLLANMHHGEFPGQTASLAHINNDKDFLSTRVSFKLDLTGPSYTLQTACSASLVAVHYACQHLRLNECGMMLAGGSVVRVPQVDGYLAERRSLHSLDGHCRPFDAGGAGTIFGSGVGAVLLKPLAQAIADRDHIYAVIKGTVVNNDGAGKSSYTAPSLGQQSQAVIDALKLAGVGPDSVGYIECHSTGTKVGDPLEIKSLTTAFRSETDARQFCAVGSVKGNIGHPEQAAGIAGLIKAALVLHHKRIPPSINFETPNPDIDFASSPFYVCDRLQDFAAGDTPRRAGLNSLGIGGTNAFAVLEEAPAATRVAGEASEPVPSLVTLSAKSADALVARVEQFLAWLDQNPSVAFEDLCYTTNVSRSQFAFRFAAAAESVEEMRSHILTWLRAVQDDRSIIRRTSDAPIAFMFSGQGTQHPGMAAELYRSQPVFRDAMDSCRALSTPHLEQDLLDVIFADGDEKALVNRTDYTQPALFAVEYSLAALLKSWGIAPDAVIGHSLGEITAACIAEIMPLEYAMRLVTKRGLLVQSLPGDGAMASVFAEAAHVRRLIGEHAPAISIAAINGPMNTSVSGEREALRILLQEFDRQKIAYRELQVSTGFHSALTDPILDELEHVASGIKYRAPKLPLISNLTGRLMQEAPDQKYWRRHLRECVRFADGVLALDQLDCRTYLEIGPHPILLPLAQACLGQDAKSSSWVATLDRFKPNARAMTEMLSALYLAGHQIDWSGVHAPFARRRMALPTYPFQRRRHWIEGRGKSGDQASSGPDHGGTARKDDALSAAHGSKANTVERTEVSVRTETAAEIPHALLGPRLDSPAKGARFETRYSVKRISYFDDHRIAGSVILPTTAALEAVTAAGRSYFETDQISIEDAMHHQAMPLASGEERIVQVRIVPLRSGGGRFELLSSALSSTGDWRTHMTGTIRPSPLSSGPDISIQEVRERCRRSISAAEFYAAADGIGLQYGPSFRGIQEMHFGQHEALTRVRLPDGLSDAGYLVHPALLDACLHSYPIALDDQAKAEGKGGDQTYLPVWIQGFRCYQDGVDEVWAHTRLRRIENDGTRLCDVQIVDLAGRPVAELGGLAVRLLPFDKIQSPQWTRDDMLYSMRWQDSPTRLNGKESGAEASWIIFADKTRGIATALASRLEASGHHCHVVHRDRSFSQSGSRQWTINERQPDDFRRLFQQIADGEALPCNGVVYLWGADAATVEDLTLARLYDDCEVLCRGALAVLQAMDATRTMNSGNRRLWIVSMTAQASSANDQVVNPVQAPLWGLGRTAALEYPGIWGGLIDLQIGDDHVLDIDQLAAELTNPDGETQIVISDRQRRVARFVNQPVADLPWEPPLVRRDATYLITGGLGLLGRSTAEWLIARGAKHLVLTGRNATTLAAGDLFDAAQLAGAEIRTVAADISREDDVRRLIENITRDSPPLRGVVHSAGVMDDGILAQLDWDRFRPVFEPRVFGGWLLHEYTQTHQLDFFILNSSLLSVLGSAGQGNYTASSAFLDALAHYRRTIGKPGTAINWSVWSGGGLAMLSGARGAAMWSSLGVEYISPELATQAFDRLMHRDVAQIAVAIADWPTYVAKVGNPLVLSELTSTGPATAPSAHVSATAISETARSRTETVSAATEASPARVQPGGSDAAVASSDPAPAPRSPEPPAFVPTNSWPQDDGPMPAHPQGAAGNESRKFHDDLQRLIAAELGFEDEIDRGQPLNELGLDSLLAVRVSNTIEKELGVTVPVPELIKGPTIDELVQEFFAEGMGTEPIRSVTTEAPVPATNERTSGGPNGSGRMQGEPDVTDAARNPVAVAHGPAPERLGQANASALNGSRRDKVHDDLQRLIAVELGFEDEIDRGQPLNELGLDSLLAVRVSNTIEKELGVTVPVPELIKGPTIDELVQEFFAEGMGTEPIRSVTTEAPVPTANERAARASTSPGSTRSEPAAGEPDRTDAARNAISIGHASAEPAGVIPERFGQANASALNGSRRDKVQDDLQRLIAAELGFEDEIDRGQPLNELGLDSLLAVRVSNSIEKELGVTVPVPELIKGPTIDDLVQEFFAEWVGAAPPEEPGPVQTSTNAIPGATMASSAEVRPRPVVPVRPAETDEERLAGQRDAGRGSVQPLGAADGPVRPITEQLEKAYTSSLGSARRRKILSVMQRLVASELGFEDEVDRDQPLNELGLDSLLAVRVSNGIENELGVTVPVADLIKGPTIYELADQIVNAASGRVANGSGGPANPSDAPVATPVPDGTSHKTTDSHRDREAGPEQRDVREDAAGAPVLGEPQRFRDREADAASADALEHTAVSHSVEARPETGLDASRVANTRAMRPGAARSNGADEPLSSKSGANGAVRDHVARQGKWLRRPPQTSTAEIRLFCFPYAGGGLASFMDLPKPSSSRRAAKHRQYVDEAIDVVAIEPPGRGKRDKEAVVEDLESFVQGLLPELLAELDRPSAFFGHCLGGLTMFATLCALRRVAPEKFGLIRHAFACGVRPPHQLLLWGDFEDRLVHKMLLHPEYNPRLPPYDQPDNLFRYIIRQFDTPDADEMLSNPALRKIYLPIVRTEFAMAYSYRHRQVEPLSVPISSFVGQDDPWVSRDHSAAWGNLTCSGFTNHVRKGSHFLLKDDRDHVLGTINDVLLGHNTR